MVSRSCCLRFIFLFIPFNQNFFWLYLEATLQIATRFSDFSEFLPERSEFAHQRPDPHYIFALQDAQIFIRSAPPERTTLIIRIWAGALFKIHGKGKLIAANIASPVARLQREQNAEFRGFIFPDCRPKIYFRKSCIIF